EIEILESAALGDVQHVQTVIEECKALGVRFALDDFGTGYSSLSYLKRIPVEVLKIDRSFIRDILNDKEDLALVQAIASLAVTFDREVVAEGVETVEQGALLMRLGCDVAQGYYIAKPMPADNIDAWVAGFKVDPIWEEWSKREWDLRAFPLLVAQYDIRDWNENVVMKIEEGSLLVEDAKLSSESKCRFGHWYKTDGQDIFSDSALFKAIDPVHSLFHQEGDLLIQLYVDGQRDKATKKCAEFYRLKDKMLTMLDDLQREFL
ncbi:MAG: EAL domain-containing protein, partial [Cycloclasticus sp.]|nr:EAL domain-containing protein [Cycloclasticus sp.]